MSPTAATTTVRSNRVGRTRLIIAVSGLMALGATAAMPGCTTGSTSYGGSLPSYPYVGLSTTSEQPVRETLATFEGSEQTLLVIPVVDPVVPSMPSIPAVPATMSPTTETSETTPPPVPATCADLLAVVYTQTGEPRSPAGGEEFDAASGHFFVKCYATVLPSSEAPAGARSASFEIWSFPAGQPPDALVDGSSEFTDPTSFTPNAALGPDVTATAGDFTSAHDSSDGRRAARFPCGADECWLYLEEGTFAPADPDISIVDTHIANIAAALRGSVAEPVPPSEPTVSVAAPPRPTCAGLAAPIDAILATFKVTPVVTTNEEFPTNEGDDYVGCFGSLYVIPPWPQEPSPSTRTVAYQVWVFEPDREPAFLGLDPADEATPQLGPGVTSNGGSYTRILKPGSPEALTTSESRRILRFPCEIYECYVNVAETAYSPFDTDLGTLDLQLKTYVQLVRAYVATL